MNLKELNNSNDIITVSTFPEAGGLDIGTIHAGAKIVWANDMMKEACTTYSTNIGEHIIRGNINEQIDGLNPTASIVSIVKATTMLLESFQAVGEDAAYLEMILKNTIGPARQEVRETLLPRLGKDGTGN